MEMYEESLKNHATRSVESTGNINLRLDVNPNFIYPVLKMQQQIQQIELTQRHPKTLRFESITVRPVTLKYIKKKLKKHLRSSLQPSFCRNNLQH